MNRNTKSPDCLSIRSSRLPPRRERRARRRSQGGFTLVELLVAVTAGLLVSAAAFLLARNATRFFQHEARISSAQLSAVMGVERVLADIDRAAFLSTPNIQTNPRRCPQGASIPNGPQGMSRLAGIQIENGGSISGGNTLAQSVANGMSPDRITIGGSFDNNEAFPVSNVAPGAGGNFTIYLQREAHEMKRSVAAGKDLAKIFRAGRMLRFVDASAAREYYGIISGFDPLNVAVQVAASPLMPNKLGVFTCGLGLGSDTGGVVNPVSRVRYDIRSLANHPTYKKLVEAVSTDATGDAGRSELVRVELDADDNEIPETIELVAEYAVDLKFGLTAFGRGALPPSELSACSTVPGTDVYNCPIPMAPQVYTALAGPVTGGARPELIRSIQVRLATRARAPDRESDLGAGPDGRKYRFKLDLPGTPVPKFARMRTIYAEKYLRNQERQ
jgi:prepilin-type N-terminal cleavage/methylation domain-containing protein